MKRTRLLMFLLAVSLMCSFVPVAAVTPPWPDSIPFSHSESRLILWEENPVDPAVTGRINDFAYKTAVRIFQDSTDNINYSPLSLYFALSLSAAGAGGDTLTALLECLGADDAEQLSRENGRIFRRTYTDNEIGKLTIANSLWAAESFRGQPVTFQPDFLETAGAEYYAHVEQVDFDGDAGEKIAAWIREATGGLLEPSIETSSEQVLSLINTIHFYDEWTDRFSEKRTKPDIFTRLDGDEVEVDFMNREDGSASFQIGEHFSRSSLSLKNGGEMVFVLPDEDVSITEILQDEAALRDAFQGGDDFYGDVIWQIPLFDFDSSLDLGAAMADLGLASLFLETADFSRLVDQPIFVTDILQETTVAIDEKGVSAAAFTEIAYAGAAPPSGRAEMRLDRPFLYGIRNNLGQLLFIGAVFDPSR